VTRLHKNVQYSVYGAAFRFLLTALSVPIFIRFIGIGGYAAIGIVKSVLFVMEHFNFPYFLSMVHNKDDKDEKIHNTLLSSVLISNIVLLALSIPVVIILTLYVYKDNSLMLPFLIAVVYFVFLRWVSFYVQFFRSRSAEGPILETTVLWQSVQFILAIALLKLGYGVVGIFTAMLVSACGQAYMLYRHYCRVIPYRFEFSLPTLMGQVRKYLGAEYMHQLSANPLTWAGLFVASLFLDYHAIGILTIFISVSNTLKNLINPLGTHLVPVYKKKNAMAVMKDLSTFYMLFSMFIAASLFYFGRPLYLIYFGQGVSGTFLLFFVFIISQVYSFIHLITGSYLFLYRIRVLIVFNSILSLLLVVCTAFSRELETTVAIFVIIAAVRTMFHLFLLIKYVRIDNLDVQIVCLWLLLPLMFSFSFMVVLSVGYAIYLASRKLKCYSKLLSEI